MCVFTVPFFLVREKLCCFLYNFYIRNLSHYNYITFFRIWQEIIEKPIKNIYKK